MKKIILLFLPLLLWSCNNDESELLQITQETPTRQEGMIRSLSEAITIANEAAEAFRTNPQSRIARFSSGMDTHVITNAGARSGQNDTLMYIINYNNNQGFAVIAAYIDVEPVIAVIDEGNYEETVASQNPGFDLCMELAITKLGNHEPKDSIPPLKPNWDLYKEVLDTTINVRVAAKTAGQAWGQHFPEGLECPNKVSGCVPTAILLICSYFNQPNYMNYTYPNATKTFEFLNWELIKTHHYSAINENSSICKYFDCYNNGAHQQISRVARQIGVICKANYNMTDSTTGVKTSDIRQAMVQILPNRNISALESLNYAKLQNTLETGIALIRADGFSNSTGKQMAGHAWVIDGINSLRIHKTTYICKDGITDIETGPIWEYYNDYYYGYDHLHFNFGWNGMGDGYYTEELVDVSKMDENLKFTLKNFQTIIVN